MTRFFLTLLALLTGLVAQVSPAQTIMRGGESEIGATFGAARTEHRVAPSAHLAQAPASNQPDDHRCTILMRVPQHDCPPSTYIGVDRSLE